MIAAVALQTGYKPQTTPVVSDALSEEEVEKKSESVYAELCSNLDYKVRTYMHILCMAFLTTLFLPVVAFMCLTSSDVQSCTYAFKFVIHTSMV